MTPLLCAARFKPQCRVDMLSVETRVRFPWELPGNTHTHTHTYTYTHTHTLSLRDVDPAVCWRTSTSTSIQIWKWWFLNQLWGYARLVSTGQSIIIPTHAGFTFRRSSVTQGASRMRSSARSCRSLSGHHDNGTQRKRPPFWFDGTLTGLVDFKTYPVQRWH